MESTPAPRNNRAPLVSHPRDLDDVQQPTADSAGLNLDFVLRTLRKRWLLIFLATAVVTGAITFFTLGMKKIYQASATVLFDPNPPRPLGKNVERVVEMGSGSYWNHKEYYKTQYEILRSRELALVVVRELGLAHDGGFLANTPPGTAPPNKSVPEVTAADILKARVSVRPVKGTRLASVSYKDADPFRAKRIAQALADIYVRKNLEDAQSTTASSVDWLNKQLDNLKKGLNTSEMALHEYKRNNKILSVDLDAQSNMLRSQMQQLTTALTETRIRREKLAARYRELKKVSTDNPTNMPATELLNNVLLQQLRTSYIKELRHHDELLAEGKGPSHPEVRASKAAVEASKRALLAEVTNIQRAALRDLQTAQNEENGLGGLLANLKKRALNLNLLAIKYNRLDRDRRNSEKMYSTILERAKEADLVRMLHVNNIRVAEEPQVPKRPVKPNVPLNIMVGFLLGAMLGMGSAFGLELLDTSVKSEEEAERLLGYTFLGRVLALGGKSNGKKRYYGYGGRRNKTNKPFEGLDAYLFTHLDPRGAPAEAIRTIRTNLSFMSPDNPFRTWLVTSPNPSEGKTTIATNLAVAMAQAGHRVLLLDCDMRRPRVHQVFHTSPDHGLSLLLTGQDEIDHEHAKTEIENLSVVGAGPVPPNPAEMLQSERFKDVLRELQEHYDRVVLDSPPLLPVTDAAILSAQVDATVLVVRAFQTTKESLRDARRALQSVAGHVVGFVLNSMRAAGGSGGYRYRYSHDYGTYHSQSATTESETEERRAC